MICLREASKLLRDTKAWTHPFYWAAFAVNGLVQPTVSFGEGWPPADLPAKMKIYAQQSTRNRSEMTNEKIIEDTELLLKDLLDDYTEVWQALQPPYALSQAVAQQQVAAGQRGLAEALHLIVRDNPALHEFAAENGAILRIDPQQHQERHQSTPSAENSGQVWNEVSDIFEVFNAVVQQEYESNAKKKHNKRGILKRVFDQFLPSKGDWH